MEIDTKLYDQIAVDMTYFISEQIIPALGRYPNKIENDELGKLFNEVLNVGKAYHDIYSKFEKKPYVELAHKIQRCST